MRIAQTWFILYTNTKSLLYIYILFIATSNTAPNNGPLLARSHWPTTTTTTRQYHNLIYLPRSSRDCSVWQRVALRDRRRRLGNDVANTLTKLNTARWSRMNLNTIYKIKNKMLPLRKMQRTLAGLRGCGSFKADLTREARRVFFAMPRRRETDWMRIWQQKNWVYCEYTHYRNNIQLQIKLINTFKTLRSRLGKHRIQKKKLIRVHSTQFNWIYILCFP